MSVLDRMPDVELAALIQVAARENMVLAEGLAQTGHLSAEPPTTTFKLIVEELKMRGYPVTSPIFDTVVRPLNVLMLNDSPVGVYLHEPAKFVSDAGKAAEAYKLAHPEREGQTKQYLHVRGPFILGTPAAL